MPHLVPPTPEEHPPMVNPYDELSDRARWYMENFDELGIAEICASSDAAAEKAQAAVARVKALATDMRTWCSPYGIAVDYADRIDDAINGPLEPADGRNPIVIHACPPDGSGLTPCCGKTPFELPRKDRMAPTPSHATCPGIPTIT